MAKLTKAEIQIDADIAEAKRWGRDGEAAVLRALRQIHVDILGLVGPYQALAQLHADVEALKAAGEAEPTVRMCDSEVKTAPKPKSPKPPRGKKGGPQ